MLSIRKRLPDTAYTSTEQRIKIHGVQSQLSADLSLTNDSLEVSVYRRLQNLSFRSLYRRVKLSPLRYQWQINKDINETKKHGLASLRKYSMYATRKWNLSRSASDRSWRKKLLYDNLGKRRLGVAQLPSSAFHLMTLPIDWNSALNRHQTHSIQPAYFQACLVSSLDFWPYSFNAYTAESNSSNVACYHRTRASFVTRYARESNRGLPAESKLTDHVLDQVNVRSPGIWHLDRD